MVGHLRLNDHIHALDLADAVVGQGFEFFAAAVVEGDARRHQHFAQHFHLQFGVEVAAVARNAFNVDFLAVLADDAVLVARHLAAGDVAIGEVGADETLVLVVGVQLLDRAQRRQVDPLVGDVGAVQRFAEKAGVFDAGRAVKLHQTLGALRENFVPHAELAHAGFSLAVFDQQFHRGALVFVLARLLVGGLHDRLAAGVILRRDGQGGEENGGRQKSNGAASQSFESFHSFHGSFQWKFSGGTLLLRIAGEYSKSPRKVQKGRVKNP